MTGTDSPRIRPGIAVLDAQAAVGQQRTETAISESADQGGMSRIPIVRSV